MAHWLMKSEPSSWSWDEQVKAGAKGTGWTGVRNHLAKKHMMAMQLGDTAFFYHSNQDRAIIGIVKIIHLYHPDPTDESGKFGMVDVEAVRPLPKAVTLEAIKAEPRLAAMQLVVNSRLSVQPVTETEWRIISEMGGV